MPLNGYLKVLCKTDTLVDIKKFQRHVPYLIRYLQALNLLHKKESNELNLDWL